MILHTAWSQARCSEFKGGDLNLLTYFLTFLISSSFVPAAAAAAAELTLSGCTACSSRMLLVLGQRLGFLYTPTTPFHQAGIPTTINQSGDSPWMSVNMFPSLPLFPTTFLSHSLVCSCDCSFSLFIGVSC